MKIRHFPYVIDSPKLGAAGLYEGRCICREYTSAPTTWKAALNAATDHVEAKVRSTPPAPSAGCAW